LKLPRDKPRLLVKRGGELHLSSQAVTELMKAVFDKGAPFRFQAKGGSMFPFIREGDKMTLLAVKSLRIKTGDVVAFHHPESKKFTVHRVIKRTERSYLIKGDNNPAADGLIPESEILGRVDKIERGTKKDVFGLGPEKYLIALVSRCQLFSPLFLQLQKAFFRPFCMRSKR
jgi:signal peptidase I